MSSNKNPTAFAREAIRLLGERQLPPTPENFASAYRELAGETTAVPDAAVKPLNWAGMIRSVLRQLETPHKGITLSRKKDGLEVVLNRFAGKPDVLFDKLNALQQSWGAAGSDNSTLVAAARQDPPPSGPVSATGPTVGGGSSAILDQLRELLAQSLESALITHPELDDEIRQLAARVRTTRDPAHINELAKPLRQFWLKLELRGGDKVRIQEGLLRLLRLLVENVSELVSDDEWVHGQISALQDIIIQPLDKRSIADAERSLREVVIRQSTLKQSLNDAKTTLKSLMTTFIDRLGNLTESTGEYHQKIEGYSQKISNTNSLTDLSHLLEDIMQDTRIIQASALRSHEELLATRKQADEAENRIRELEQELMQVSELVREDQLTGALNRRGMDEAMEVELKRADRNQTPLSVALLDIDDFKKLNDTLGHQAGDHALSHLSKVIRETLRPTDAVGRYGGEEFVIILPDTPLDAAVETLQRLQRDLTKKFFLHNHEKVLVTFSAGVALRGEDEDQQDLLGRADKAMYQAKLAGKNRVVAAI